MVGIGGVLVASSIGYAALQLAGAAYLVHLGIKKWRTASAPLQTASRESMPSPASLFTQGMFVALSNPKAILFFLALLPQFIQANRPLLPQFAALTSILLAFSFSALMGYSVLARTGRRLAPGSAGLVAANRIIAIVFVGLGVFMLARAVTGR
ncbi:hypothetical protein GCM10009097_14190 [Pigmentiphaga daeguensis]|uniref:Threonine/homoserine/homoserine lactone efflux protein n=1 Tax=Pigmentiphaga daeguensis TaxID=414049 RepID=A0ABP3LJM0_9BURK